MTRAAPALLAIALLVGCVEEPTVKDAEKAMDMIEKDEVKETKKTIEEAADEAAKLVEADAKAEIDALEPSPNE